MKCSIRTRIDNVFLHFSRIFCTKILYKKKSNCASVNTEEITVFIFEHIMIISIMNLIVLGFLQSVQVKAYSPPHSEVSARVAMRAVLKWGCLEG